jgi:hypothetical protein
MLAQIAWRRLPVTKARYYAGIPELTMPCQNTRATVRVPNIFFSKRPWLPARDHQFSNRIGSESDLSCIRDVPDVSDTNLWPCLVRKIFWEMIL